jgi:hypothetical protein
MKTIKNLLLLALIFSAEVQAEAKYDPKENAVTIRSRPSSGYLTIYAGNRIRIGGLGMPVEGGKNVGLCSKNTDLGLVYLNGRDSLAPKVSKIVPYDEPSGGLVRAYELTDDNAADMMDYLLEYDVVGLAVRSDCPESELYRPGWSTFKFDTRGLERALKRIKQKD